MWITMAGWRVFNRTSQLVDQPGKRIFTVPGDTFRNEFPNIIITIDMELSVISGYTN